MSYSNLLERLMQRDTDAFLEMTDRYGWTLYQEIRKKYPNKADADRIYDETMQYFYRSMQNPVCEDPVEALLCAMADKIAQMQGLRPDYSSNPELLHNQEPPAVQVSPSYADVRVEAEKRKRGFWFRTGMLVVILGFLAVIWVTVGLMMEAGILPYVDLGYSWFSDLAARWL